MQGRPEGRRYEMRLVGNHLRRDNCARVVDWQNYESTIENRVNEQFKSSGAGVLGVREEV